VILGFHPTRGLDIGATEAVHRMLLDQRRAGAAILLISEDLDEILLLSDRIAVIFGGELTGMVRADEVSVEEIGLMMGGGARHPTGDTTPSRLGGTSSPHASLP
jgi:simple sugar transport system ATP-binding protein